jgi:hypothetical protein
LSKTQNRLLVIDAEYCWEGQPLQIPEVSDQITDYDDSKAQPISVELLSLDRLFVQTLGRCLR